MLSIKSFETATHGRRFLPVVNDPTVPARQVLHLLNDPQNLDGMAFVTENIDYPALGAIVKKLERIPEVDKYFRSTPSRDTLKFRQCVGMAVRLAMEGNGFRTTGKKGYIGSISDWFTRAEIFASSSFTTINKPRAIRK